MIMDCLKRTGMMQQLFFDESCSDCGRPQPTEAIRETLGKTGSATGSTASDDALPAELTAEVLAAVDCRIVVLDRFGNTVWSNWLLPGEDKEAVPRPVSKLRVGDNYLAAWRLAAAGGNASAAQVLGGLERLLRGELRGFQLEYPWPDTDPCSWYQTTISPLAAARGAVLIHKEISAQKRIEYELKRCRALLARQPDGRSTGYDDAAANESIAAGPRPGTYFEPHADDTEVIAKSSAAIVVTDAHCRIVKVNGAFTEITGFDRAEVLGAGLSLLRSHDGDRCKIDAIWYTLQTTGTWQGEVCNARKNGERYVAWETLNVVRDDGGRVTSYVSVFSDITPIVSCRNQLQSLVHHDALTGMANRVLLQVRLKQSIDHAKRHGGCVGVLFIDIDEFKRVNDGLGHKAGDELLKTLADRLQRNVRGEDTVARFGGDEFVVVAEEIEGREAALALAEKLRLTIRQPVKMVGHSLTATASIGVALYPDDGDEPDSLVSVADARMYRDKGSREREGGIDSAMRLKRSQECASDFGPPDKCRSSFRAIGRSADP